MLHSIRLKEEQTEHEIRRVVSCDYVFRLNYLPITYISYPYVFDLDLGLPRFRVEAYVYLLVVVYIYVWVLHVRAFVV